jgi:hypothetical protein
MKVALKQPPAREPDRRQHAVPDCVDADGFADDVRSRPAGVIDVGIVYVPV